MRKMNRVLLFVFAHFVCNSAPAADRRTMFEKELFSTVHEMKDARDLQKTIILKAIEDVDLAHRTPGFGIQEGGLSLAVIVLQPDLATEVKVYAAIVLRNDSVEPIRFQGPFDRVLRLTGYDDSGQVLPRTRFGEQFQGPEWRPRVGGPRDGPVVLQARSQVVLDLNLAELFQIRKGSTMTLTAGLNLKNETTGAPMEVVAPSNTIRVKPDDGRKSVFDPPQLPPDLLARAKAYEATNRIPLQAQKAESARLARQNPVKFMSIGGSTQNGRTNLVPMVVTLPVQSVVSNTAAPSLKEPQPVAVPEVERPAPRFPSRTGSLAFIIASGAGLAFGAWLLFRCR